MEALGNKTTVKILKVLFDDPLQEYKEIDLIVKAGVGKGSAATAINNLVQEGILLQKKAGKAKLLSFNFQNKKAFLLKSLLDEEKINLLSGSRLAALLFFKSLVQNKVKMLLVFGSTISGTATAKSDIDILIILSNPKVSLEEDRKRAEEVFGERLNLHPYTERLANVKADNFLKNAILRGVILHGYDTGARLYSQLKEKKGIERLLFLMERVRSAERNYLSKDNATAIEVIETAVEQLIYDILSEKEILYTSKKDALESMKKLKEGATIKKMLSAPLREKIALAEKFIISIIEERILAREGYGKRGN